MEYILYDKDTGRIVSTITRHQNLEKVLSNFQPETLGIIPYKNLPEIPPGYRIDTDTLEFIVNKSVG